MEGVTYGQDGRGIPVLTYEEMAGLVLGYDPWELGMQMHQVDVEPLLEKMGIDYDPAAKYLGRHGKFIGKPAPSAVNCGVQDMIYNIKAQREVINVGGGVAGIQTALRLADRGIRPTIVEKESDLGGKLRGWYHLFPSLTPASEVLSELRRRLAAGDVEVMTSAEAVSITPGSVTLADGRTLECGSVVVCSGFTLFDARLKEEYGYGVYDNVFTSADIERMLNEGNVTTSSGRRPRRIALLHCVGSRDEKVCQAHCSRVCCITGVKQAMELKRLFPDADVFNFYMDIRMFGPGYEEMYREAQQNYNIHFVRGRISEASPTYDGRLQIKAEDTLTGRPLRMSVDMLVLLVGMRANDSNADFAASAGLRQAPSGFMEPQDLFLNSARSGVDGIFYAGTVTAPKNIGETLNEADAAVEALTAYLGRV